MINHRSYTHNLSSCELKPEEKNWGLNGIRTHDLSDTYVGDDNIASS